MNMISRNKLASRWNYLQGERSISCLTSRYFILSWFLESLPRQAPDFIPVFIMSEAGAGRLRGTQRVSSAAREAHSGKYKGR
jgi:hypothetical protein